MFLTDSAIQNLLREKLAKRIIWLFVLHKPNRKCAVVLPFKYRSIHVVLYYQCFELSSALFSFINALLTIPDCANRLNHSFSIR